MPSACTILLPSTTHCLLPTAHLEREQQPLRLGDGEAGGDGNDAELRHVLVVQQRLGGVKSGLQGGVQCGVL